MNHVNRTKPWGPNVALHILSCGLREHKRFLSVEQEERGHPPRRSPRINLNACPLRTLFSSTPKCISCSEAFLVSTRPGTRLPADRGVAVSGDALRRRNRLDGFKSAGLEVSGPGSGSTSWSCYRNESAQIGNSKQAEDNFTNPFEEKFLPQSAEDKIPTVMFDMKSSAKKSGKLGWLNPFWSTVRPGGGGNEHQMLLSNFQKKKKNSRTLSSCRNLISPNSCLALHKHGVEEAPIPNQSRRLKFPANWADRRGRVTGSDPGSDAM
ncbi:uncharacterized protein [Antennarius striatus]|uniref:uncharacterized protein n=1 Tax=Antennarius striatus TaxID=241820 RepID=UPI0035AF04BC